MRVGDYIRTENGIAKIIDIVCGEDLWFDNDNIFDEDEKFVYRLNKPSMYSNWANNNIIKSSPNIIDLIKVGDYVNGKKVGFINDSDYYDDIFLSESWDKPFETMIVANYKDIKSIVTHEQFKAMEYEVNK